MQNYQLFNKIFVICFFLRSFIMWLLWSFFCLEAYHMVSQSFLYKEPIILQGKPTKLGCCKIIGILVLLGLQEVQDRATWSP